MPEYIEKINIESEDKEQKYGSGNDLLPPAHRPAKEEKYDKDKGDRTGIDERETVRNISLKCRWIHTGKYFRDIEITLYGKRNVLPAALSP